MAADARAFSNLAGAEYFIDTDPGAGNAIALVVEDGAFDALAETVLPAAIATDGLAAGAHRLGLRFLDSAGEWGNAIFLDFLVVEASALVPVPPLADATNGAVSPRMLAAAHYAVDGGSTVAVPSEDGSFDSMLETILPQALAASGLAPGTHRIELRFQDSVNEWGNSTYLDVRVEDAGALVLTPPLTDATNGALVLRNIAAAEYAVDGGAAVAVAAEDGVFDTSIETTLSQSLAANALSAGPHRLELRFKDTADQWGNPTYLDVRVEDAGALVLTPPLTDATNGPVTLRNIAAAEYAMDGGAAVAVAAEDGVFDTTTEAILPQALAVSALATGPHRLELRFKDTAEQWGNPAYLDVRVEDAGGLVLTPPLTDATNGALALRSIAAVEYTVDGGTATPATPEDGTFDTLLETIFPQSVGADSLAAGPHRLGLRFKDSANDWGSPVFLDVQVEDAGALVVAPPLLNATSGPVAWRTIMAAEYFLDEDVPPGTASPLAAQDAPFDGVAESVADTTIGLGTLSAGFHRVGLRLQSTDGHWGTPIYQGFRVFALAPEPPSIVLQPANTTVNLGQPFNLTVVANGEAPLAYQWFKGGSALPAATNETYAIAAAQVTNAGSYFAIVTNTLGSVTSRVAVVTVFTLPPVIHCPSNIVSDCAGPGGTPVSFTASAVDAFGVPVPVVCVPASGSLFAVGMSAVACVAMDTLGGSNSCGFTVTVEDRLPPAIQCPGNIVSAIDAGECGALVDYAAHSLSATDNCSGAPIVCVPPSSSLLPVGTNGVTCTAQDAAGNTAQCSFTVAVIVRPEAPVFSVTYPERDGRMLSNQVQVCLTTSFTNGTIYFTDDGSVPDAGAKRYTNCVELFYEGVFPDVQVVTLKAIAVSSNGLVTAAACPLDVVLTPFCDGNFKLLTKAAADGGGEVRKNPVREKYPCNVVVRAEAHPAAGWTFMGWLGDASGTNPVTSVLMTRDKCVEGVFGTTLRTNAIGNGSVRVAPAAPLYPYGSQVSIFAVPAPGHYFVHWTNLLGVDITPAGRTANPFRQRITDALPTLTAVFQPSPPGQHTLTVLVEGLGSVSVSPYSNRYPSSVIVTNRATPSAGQAFLGWSGDASGASTPLLITMDQSRVITANFTRAPRLELYRCEGKLAGDVFQLVMKGELGGAFVLERAEELGAPVQWQNLGVFTNTLGWAQFDDPYPPGVRQRFYRLMLVP